LIIFGRFRADETAKKSEPSGADRSGTESAKITQKSTESVESTKVLGVDYTAEQLAAVERYNRNFLNEF